MATLLLLHSALGLRPAVNEFADHLRSAGHDVVVPDYYDGQVFDDPTDGLAHRDLIGAPVLLSRVREQLHDVPANAVLAGFSLGAAFAQRLAADRPQAAGVVLLHHVSAPRGTWSGQPTQVHRYAVDPFVIEDEATALAAAVTRSGATFEEFVVPGTGHLFTDSGQPDFDACATQKSLQLVGELLQRSSEQ